MAHLINLILTVEQNHGSTEIIYSTEIGSVTNPPKA